MGTEWDGRGSPHSYQQWVSAWARQTLRILKPGGHLVAFGSPRTYHRLACGIEDAGFEIRDCCVNETHHQHGPGCDELLGVPGLVWIYGQGLPKSRNLDDAWAGWGSGLKPAHEPIVVARKPLAGTIATNVERFGTGALHIDACRIEIVDAAYAANCAGDRGHADNRTRRLNFRMGAGQASDLGRWPANLILDETAAAELDRQSGTLTSGANPTRRHSPKFQHVYSPYAGDPVCSAARGKDAGGASRFFYIAKASRDERVEIDGVRHIAVKPLNLVRLLVKLVVPPEGRVLDPFLGSGTTAEAALLEGCDFGGCELAEEYLPLIQARIDRATRQATLLDHGYEHGQGHGSSPDPCHDQAGWHQERLL